MDLAPVVCSNSGTPNEAGRKFCSECGHGLGVACKVCGTLNAPSVKFCGECGSPMQADYRATFVPLVDGPAVVASTTDSSRSRVPSA